MARHPADEAYEAVAPRLDPPMVVVTARYGDERAGCLVGFHAQCSIDPLRYLVMISKANRTWAVARASSHLVVHFCDEGDREVARLFGGETGDRVDKFAGEAWTESPVGIPVLTRCRTWLEAKVLARHDMGDHVAHVLEWTAGEAAQGLLPLRLGALDDLEPGHEA